MNQDLHKCIACMDKIKRKLDENNINNLITKDKMNILCKVSPKGTTKTLPSAICPDITKTGCPHGSCTHPNFVCNDHKNKNNVKYDKEFDYAYRTLFRIRVNNIPTGITLHVIKLDGETSDLKMSFSYDDEGSTELINIIKYLTE